ncbi:MAG: patatin-like phospholipase family protein [Phycisphaerae bacterium]|nr:patatin-like phospholipase family protein [Phycisphaerae bacterium]
MRVQRSDAELQVRAAADAERSEAVFRAAIARLVERMARECDSGADGFIPTVDFLALSGGGDYGAFGAGLLIGWSEAPSGWARPDFDAVTGVSTGALLAPFAYIGTDASCNHVERFYRSPKDDWIQDRGLLFFLPSNPSFMTIPGLERDIRSTVDRAFVERLAEESAKGKILAISATDLDLGRQRFWDVGREAEAAVSNGDVARVQDILLASAAIPAVFPAIELDDALYADGGVTANVFLRLDVRSPDALLPQWKAAHPGKPLPKIRYWVVINNQIHQPPKTVQSTWPSVVAPSLSTAIRSATIAEVRWLAAQADYVNATWGTDIEVRVVSIPDHWRPPVEGDFRKETMESLAELGRAMGADASSWQLWTMPRQAGASEVGSGRRPEHRVVTQTVQLNRVSFKEFVQ